ncbi:MAG TPA: relaxase MobL [Pyrinomonadaceae bacterium]|nr:relaxase MobL [Pyrinomonadaceae bacterium]
MRIVVSAQAKRGSSRGLVHYIAHSKLDVQRESENGRELFNAIADHMSVENANNSLKIGIAKGRPSNDELHHLVLSFRTDDYRGLGANEKQRRRAIKDVTRAVMKRLETALAADRLSWAAAVHLNTGNPHVHIAIQKQFFTKEIERRVLSKIPREALPHYDVRDGEKVFVPGLLIEAATEKMEAIIDRERTRDKIPEQPKRSEVFKEHSGRETTSEPIEGSPIEVAAERKALAKGILAEYELRSIDARIDSLLDHGDKMRFSVNDPKSGQRRRLSLRELENRLSEEDTDQHAAPERQIKTILHKMLAKEEASKIQLKSETADVIRETKRIRAEYRKNGRRLPIPSLSKPEIDELQQQCFEASDIRRFSYLERIRTELERSGEIEPRSKGDLRSILGQTTVSELRFQLYEKKHEELRERGYYRPVDLGGRSMALVQLDREHKERENPVVSIFEKLRNTAAWLSKKGKNPTRADETVLRNDIIKKLDEEIASIRKEAKAEQNKARMLENILNVDPQNRGIGPSYSPEQLAEIEKLSVRLSLKPVYERNWKDQRLLIESAGSDCVAYKKLLKADPTTDFGEHKNRIIAGRALAREIVARVEFEKAREDLKIFQEAKRFQKFAVSDKKTGGVVYLSQHDVDLPHRGSLLDRAADELFEGREHRAFRRTVESLVKGKEQRLKDDVKAAKKIMVSASCNASEFKEFSYLGLRSTTPYQPIFTSAEIAMLEVRAANTRSPKEAERLQTLVDSATNPSVRSLRDLMLDFENPRKTHSEVKKIHTPTYGQPGRAQVAAQDDGPQKPVIEKNKVPSRTERPFQDHLR